MRKRHFNAKTAITRAEAASILYRILGTPKSEKDAAFADEESIPTYAREAILSLYGQKLFNRQSGGCINARGLLTRADAATILASVLDYLK